MAVTSTPRYIHPWHYTLEHTGTMSSLPYSFTCYTPTSGLVVMRAGILSAQLGVPLGRPHTLLMAQSQGRRSTWMPAYRKQTHSPPEGQAD